MLFVVAPIILNAAVTLPVLTSSRIPLPSIAARPPACPRTEIPTGGRFVFMGFYEGSGDSTVTVAGTEEETTTGTIQIAAGKEPIDLVLTSSKSMIYRLTGATNRLHSVHVLYSKGAGVTGLPRSKISFENCQSPASAGVPSAESAQALSSVFGRKPDAIGGTYELHRVRVDRHGFVYQSAPRLKDRSGLTALQQDALLFSPGGVVRINPRSVVASGDAVRYEILPSTAGAAQLERQGAIVAVDPDAVHLLRVKAAQKYGPNIFNKLGLHPGYYVRRPIRLPVGLCGSHSLTFIVPDASYVTGHPCHSTVVATDGTIIAAPFTI